MSIHYEGVCHNTADCLLGAVIGIGIAPARDRDLVLRFTVLDIQIAIYGFDFIIIRTGTLVQLIGKDVLRAANQRLAAGYTVGRTFIFDEAITRHGYIIVGQRAAVIFPLGRA